MDEFVSARAELDDYLERVRRLDARYRAGDIHVHVPAELADDEPLEGLIRRALPDSSAALDGAARNLFFSLPVAFDPAHSVGPYLATVDRDAAGEPYRFIDMGAMIATQALGENDPQVVEAMVRGLPFVVSRYAHSEYQTSLSLRLKAQLDRIAPAGTPRHFVVNTGAEAVENAIKAVLLNRVLAAGEARGGFIVSFEGAFHGRTLGSLAVTQRKKAKLGFPTFDWPHVTFPALGGSTKETARREERSLKQLWDLLLYGRLAEADRRRESFRRELEAIEAFLAAPGGEPAGLWPRVAPRSRPSSSSGAAGWPPCSWSRSRARAACAWRVWRSCSACGSSRASSTCRCCSTRCRPAGAPPGGCGRTKRSRCRSRPTR